MDVKTRASTRPRRPVAMIAAALVTASLVGLVATSPTPRAAAQEIATPEAARPMRVGIQVGHWQAALAVGELWRLRGQTGSFAGGVSEWEVNLQVAQEVVRLLEQQGIVADLLPVTIPPGYTADAFVALHADGELTGQATGFKAARAMWRDRGWLRRWRREQPRSRWSRDIWSRAPTIERNPRDQRLLDLVIESYAAVTGLPQSPSVSRQMTGYYAFNSRRYAHAISSQTPGVILEMGYLTNAGERRFLVQRPEVPARAVAQALLRFLAEDEQPQPSS